MKIAIYLLIGILLIGNVTAYSGLNAILPPPLFDEFLEFKVKDISNDAWAVRILYSGTYRHKINSPPIALKEINFTLNKRINYVLYFITSYYNETGNLTYSGFKIESNLNRDDAENIRLVFEINNEWLIKNNIKNVYVLKNNNKINANLIYKDNDVSVYYVDIKEFSKFLIIGEQVDRKPLKIEIEKKEIIEPVTEEAKEKPEKLIEPYKPDWLIKTIYILSII